MSERQKLVSRLINERDFRADYIRAKLEVLVPSQLRALRLRQELTQPVLAEMAGMKQSRISAIETPGKVNFNQETLVRIAATHKVGLIMKFVPFSEMLDWENDYSQDSFNPTRLDNDADFLQPETRVIRRRPKGIRRSRRARSTNEIGQMPILNERMNLSRMFGQQERVQMRLRFEPQQSSGKLADVIPMPTSRSGALSDRAIPKMAPGTGAQYAFG